MSRYQMDIGDAEMYEPEEYQPDAERARRELAAREALMRRLQERQAMQGYMDQGPPMVDELGPNPMAGPPQPAPAPRPVQPQTVQPAFDSVPDSPVGIGQAVMTSPPPQLQAGPQGPQTPSPSLSPTPGQLAPTTPPLPAPVADSSTDPNTPTITAGAQAQALSAPQPGAPIGGAMGAAGLGAPRPSGMGGGGPRMALGGATGLGGPDLSQRLQAEAGPPSYEDRLGEARSEDARRDRIRNIMRVLAAVGGLATAKGGGGGGILGAAGAALTRPSDQVANLQADDARDQALGTEQARRQAIMDQLAQRREAMGLTQSNAEQDRAIRMQELLGTQQDRQMRTGIELRENEREEDLLDPASDVSGRERQALQTALAGQPREVQRNYQGLERLSATELRSLRDDLERGGRARVIAGHGRGPVGGAGGGPLASVDAAPDSYVRSIQQASPSMSAGDARRAADIQWGRMRPRAQAAWLATPDAQRLAEVVGRDIPGYQQANAGAAIDEAQYQQARTAVANQQSFDAAMGRALTAAQEIEALPAGEQAMVRAGDMVGYEGHDALAAYNDARGAVIATLNRLAEAGVMNESEYLRWERQLPAISDFRSLGDATRRLRQVQARVREMTEARLDAAGYRRAQGGGAVTTTGQPVQEPGVTDNRMVTVGLVNADGRTRVVRMPAERAERIRAAMPQGVREMTPAELQAWRAQQRGQ